MSHNQNISSASGAQRWQASTSHQNSSFKPLSRIDPLSGIKPEKPRGRFGRAPYQRTPDKERSKRRRQMLAAMAPMAPAMMAQLTPSQQAYAKFIADETIRTGDCRLSLDEIAARCGMCSKTAQRAQQRLRQLNWVHVEYRPIHGRKHDTNVVTITSIEWRTWIALGKTPSRLGRQNCLATGNGSFILGVINDLERIRNAPRALQPPDEGLMAALNRLKAGLKRE